jgi:ubiquinone/menaquinone biosynthesis C-methylase UbiE
MPAGVDDELVPPKEMLHDGSSSPEEFALFGENFCTHVLIPRAQLHPSAAVLDMGCGNGAVGRALTRYLTPPGHYEGLDIHGPAIVWLQEHYRRYPNFRFTHANVWNKMYNPGGTVQAADYRFPFADASFDLVLLKSVFTHMLPPDLPTYLREVHRVLKPGGRSVITYFLLNSESRQLIEQGKDVHGLRHEYGGDPLCRIAHPDLPESVVAHDEQRIRDYYRALGDSVVEVSFGNWCGRATVLGHQDVVIAIRQ